MKKSERYQAAMFAVVECQLIDTKSKLEIIETLLGDKSVAEYVEGTEEEKNG